MAPLAEQRLLHYQHRLVRRSVRVMAVQAVLAHRRVLEKERTPLFRVALVALVIHRICRDQLDRLGSVRVMAGGANQLFFADRMVGSHHDLVADLLMATRTELHLRRPGQQLWIAAMDRVAIDARQLRVVMLAAMPQRHIPARMAGQASRVALGGGFILGVIHQAADATPAASAYVIRGRPMAALAAESRGRSPWVAAKAVRLIHVAVVFIQVALRAGLCADILRGR
jgi:hypothetical protein